MKYLSKMIATIIFAMSFLGIASAPVQAAPGTWVSVTVGTNTNCHRTSDTTFPFARFVYCGDLTDTTVNNTLMYLRQVPTYAPYAATKMANQSVFFYYQVHIPVKANTNSDANRIEIPD